MVDGAPRVSVVIPTLDEAAELPRALAALRQADPSLEVIVADGGSADDTPGIALSFPGVQLVRSPRGRGRQMNAGAAASRGEILWFLHADTRVSAAGIALMRERMRDPGIVGGAFRLAFDSPKRRYRLLERSVAIRCRVLGLPYGDQAVFVRREAFVRIGGFPEWPILEDVAFVRRLRRVGRLALLSEAAVTSPRRYETRGFLRTTLRNAAVLALYAMGLSPSALVRLAGRKPAAPACNRAAAPPHGKKVVAIPWADSKGEIS